MLCSQGVPPRFIRSIWYNESMHMATHLRKTKRQTMGVEDVLSGIEEAEYGEFVDHLRSYVNELQAGKNKKKKAGAIDAL